MLLRGMLLAEAPRSLMSIPAIMRTTPAMGQAGQLISAALQNKLHEKSSQMRAEHIV